MKVTTAIIVRLSPDEAEILKRVARLAFPEKLRTKTDIQGMSNFLQGLYYDLEEAGVT